MATTVLSSKIPLVFGNTGKKNILDEFRKEYMSAVKFYVDRFWDGIVIESKNKKFEFDPKQRKFDLPEFISTVNLTPPGTRLSARALKSASGQAIGILSSCTEKLRRQQYVMRNKMREGADVRKLQRKYDKSLFRLKKPVLKSANPELNSGNIFVDWGNLNHFDGIIGFYALFRDSRGLKVSIPIKKTAHLNYLMSQGRLMAGVMLTRDSVILRIEIEKELLEPEDGRVIGADQGSVTTLTLSDGQVTGKCIHGHDLNSIQKKMTKKKKGSKAFRRAQQHRTNYINWSVKQLNLQGVSELRLEKLRSMGKGKRQSRFLQAWTYTEIRTAVEKTCFMSGVRFLEQSNEYRSQRCSCCGFVHKSNRKGKLFRCKKCGFTHDADLNAALNHEINLSRLPFGLRSVQLNRGAGFYWTPNGLLSVDGYEFTVRNCANGTEVVLFSFTHFVLKYIRRSVRSIDVDETSNCSSAKF